MKSANTPRWRRRWRWPAESARTPRRSWWCSAIHARRNGWRPAQQRPRPRPVRRPRRPYPPGTWSAAHPAPRCRPNRHPDRRRWRWIRRTDPCEPWSPWERTRGGGDLRILGGGDGSRCHEQRTCGNERGHELKRFLRAILISFTKLPHAMYIPTHRLRHTKTGAIPRNHAGITVRTPYPATAVRSGCTGNWPYRRIRGYWRSSRGIRNPSPRRVLCRRGRSPPQSPHGRSPTRNRPGHPGRP